MDRSPEKDQKLIEYLEEQKSKGISALITGNVALEENHKVYEGLC